MLKNLDLPNEQRIPNFQLFLGVVHSSPYPAQLPSNATFTCVHRQVFLTVGSLPPWVAGRNEFQYNFLCNCMYFIVCVYKYYSKDRVVGFMRLTEGLLVPQTAKNPHQRSNLFSAEHSHGAVLKVLIGSCHSSVLKPSCVLGIKYKLLTLALKDPV